MISVRHRGSLDKTLKFLMKAAEEDYLSNLDKYGQMGIEALQAATPKESGRTANSWSYQIVNGDSGPTITWTNSNVNKGVNIAIILQYGHGTGTGGYVVGRDYINPTLQPIFDQIAENAWKELIQR